MISSSFYQNDRADISTHPNIYIDPWDDLHKVQQSILDDPFYNPFPYKEWVNYKPHWYQKINILLTLTNKFY